MPYIATASLFVSALVAFLAFRRQDVREHHRWLQEKRREAYVEFLSTTRRAYKAFSATDWKTEDERNAAVNHADDEVSYALDVVSLVGPEDMAERGRQAVARLKLDRLFYSPTREKQLREEKTKHLDRAKATGDPGFHSFFADLYAREPFNMGAYERLHEQYPLRSFWNMFVLAARNEMAKDRPGFMDGLRARWRRRADHHLSSGHEGHRRD